MPQAVAKTGAQAPKEFNLSALIRSGLKDPTLRVGADEGQHERRISQALEGLQPDGLVSRSYGASSGGGTHFLPCPPRAASRQRVGDFSTGGALVGAQEISLTDALRPVTALERLGTTLAPIQDGDIRGGRLSVSLPARVATGWAGEDGEIELPEPFKVAAASAGVSDAVARIQLSRHLLRQAGPVLEQQLRQLLADSVVDLIEQGSIAGDGRGSSPLGILNSPIQAASQAESTPMAHELAAALRLVADQPGADCRRLGILASSADLDSWLMMERPGGQPVLTGDPSSGYLALGRPIEFSPMVPAGQSVIADWRWLSIVYYGSPSLIVNPYVSTAHNEVEINYRQMMGVAVERVTFFCKLGG